MRYLVLERETSVEEIAGKAYRNLPIAERKKAEKALIKENPQLKNMANVRAGALIRIPEGRGSERLDRRNVVDPVADLAGKVAGAARPPGLAVILVGNDQASVGVGLPLIELNAAAIQDIASGTWVNAGTGGAVSANTLMPPGPGQADFRRQKLLRP